MVLIKLDSSTLSQPGEDFSVTFNNFQLDPSKKYELCLTFASFFYSFYNISSEFSNNQLRYSNDGGTTFYNINFDNGIYSISAINNKIAAVLDANGHTVTVNGIKQYPITITPNFTTLKCDCTINNSLIGGSNFQLDFTTSLLRDLLGFTSIVVSTTQSGANPADITRGSNSLCIRCSAITGSWENSNSSNVLYGFVPNSSPGSLISLAPTVYQYLPLATNELNRIRMTLTNQIGEIQKLNGEHATYILDLRPIRE